MWTAAILKTAAASMVLSLLFSPVASPSAFAGPLTEVTLSVQGWGLTLMNGEDATGPGRARRGEQSGSSFRATNGGSDV